MLPGIPSWSIFVMQGRSVPSIFSGMNPGTQVSSSTVAREDRVDGKRQRSAQEASLLRWLQAKPPQVSPAADSRAVEIRSRGAIGAQVGAGKIITLRKALLAEGLDIVPDPLRRYPCTKVERVKGLRG
jgi:hypothetical protein